MGGDNANLRFGKGIQLLNLEVFKFPSPDSGDVKGQMQALTDRCAQPLPS